MRPTLHYTPLEKISIARPVDRLDFITSICRGKRVLDLGCYDETALVKRGTDWWLHERIGRVATSVVGIDASSKVPPEGVESGPNSRIFRGDVQDLAATPAVAGEFDVIVAGELIEHLSHALDFLRQIKALFPGRTFVATTPNSTSLTNVMLGMTRRESSHEDHVQIYSFKTLNTLCMRAGFESFELRPCFVRYTEMALRGRGITRALVRSAETVMNVGERMFPLLSAGLIVHVDTI